MRLTITTSLYHSDDHLASFLKRATGVHKELTKNSIEFEHLLVLNDATELEKRLTQDLRSPFKVINVPREPIYASWNRGYTQGTGEVICFWNVDDVRFSRAILAGLNTLSTEIDAVYFPFVYLRFVKFMGWKVPIKIKLVLPPPYDPERFRREMHAGPHFMAHRRAFEENGHFDETFTIAGDFEWWSRFARRDLRARRVNAISGVFTNDGTTLSGSRSQKHQIENERIFAQT